MTVQVLRFHNFSIRESEIHQWITFSDYLISRVLKIVILGRKDVFMQALTGWFNDYIYDTEVRRKTHMKSGRLIVKTLSVSIRYI